MECADKGLFDIIEEKSVSPPQDFYDYAHDCLSALKHISKQKVTHLEIMPPNILYFVKDDDYKPADWAGAIELLSFRTKTNNSSCLYVYVLLENLLSFCAFIKSRFGFL